MPDSDPALTDPTPAASRGTSRVRVDSAHDFVIDPPDDAADSMRGLRQLCERELAALEPLAIDEGVINLAVQMPSVNCNNRPEKTCVSLLVVHCISLPPGQYGGNAIERLFCNRLIADEHSCYRDIADMKVSAHVLVRRDASLLQFVNLHQRAWHAGVSEFRGQAGCNDFSVGIELEGAEDQPFELCQYARLAQLAAVLMDYFPSLAADAIVGHEDIAPGRKTDPGEYFKWDLLRRMLDVYSKT